MNQFEFRPLRADEILVRVERINNNNLTGTVVLYKDARCDMRILDETVGPLNWYNKHFLLGNSLYCEIGIKNQETGEWVRKDDVGAEQNFEREKTLASDSLKRAGFVWGIGRELYTTPKGAQITLTPNETELGRDQKNVFMRRDALFFVKNITYNKDHKITSLEIVDNNGAIRYTYPYDKAPTNAPVNNARPAQPGPSSQYRQYGTRRDTAPSPPMPPTPPMIRK